MSMRMKIAPALLAASLIPLPAIAGTYIEFDPPHALNSQAVAINEKGDVAGESFPNRNGHDLGYVRAADGHFEILKADGFDVMVHGLNAHRDVFGNLYSTESQAAFVADSEGHMTIFTVPSGGETYPSAMADNGDIVGTSSDVPAYAYRGFLRHADGSFAFFDGPDAGTGLHQGTFVTAVNEQGFMALYVTDATDTPHPYLRSPDGEYTGFTVPGVGPKGATTCCISSNNAIAGVFYNDRGGSRGYVRTSRGKITTFNPPGSKLLDVYGIAADGTVVGDFADKTGSFHGYLRAPDGTLAILDPPGADPYATARGINAKGQVAGGYQTGESSHSFVWTP